MNLRSITGEIAAAVSAGASGTPSEDRWFVGTGHVNSDTYRAPLDSLEGMIGDTRDRWDRPRLAIVGTSVADVVHHAGGLIFDKVMAGWDTMVLIPNIADAKPLQILGTKPLDLESALARRDESARLLDWPPLDAIIASESLVASDERVRTKIADVIGQGSP